MDEKADGPSNDVFSTNPTFEVAFPQAHDQKAIPPDAEVFDVVVKQRIRIHDYETLFSYPGLYDHVVEQRLQCQSPQVLVGLLKKQLSTTTKVVRILDVAAGNGRVGAELRSQLSHSPGIKRLIGVELLELAKPATARDRKPNPYDEYIVADLKSTSNPDVKRLREGNFDVVVVCAALGPGDGDLPLVVLEAASEIVAQGGLLAFTVGEGILNGDAGYRAFLEKVGEGEKLWGRLQLLKKERYKHRLNTQGKWIMYNAFIYERGPD